MRCGSTMAALPSVAGVFGMRGAQPACRTRERAIRRGAARALAGNARGRRGAAAPHLRGARAELRGPVHPANSSAGPHARQLRPGDGGAREASTGGRRTARRHARGSAAPAARQNTGRASGTGYLRGGRRKPRKAGSLGATRSRRRSAGGTRSPPGLTHSFGSPGDFDPDMVPKGPDAAEMMHGCRNWGDLRTNPLPPCWS